LLLEIIFALNKEYLPAPKWRVFYSCNLKWLPEDYKELIKEAMKIKNFSVRDFDLRLKAIRKIWHNILPKIKDETGLTQTRSLDTTLRRFGKLLAEATIPNK